MLSALRSGRRPILPPLFCRRRRRLSDDGGIRNDPEINDFEPLPNDILLGLSDTETHDDHRTPRRRFLDTVLSEADHVMSVLRQDGPGFNTRAALDEMQLNLSSALVREVLLRILLSINAASKARCAKLAYKFFAWSGQQEGYRHTPNAYNLTIKIFADSEELKAMWRLVEEMTRNGLPVTARTFNILICTCGEAGMARRLVERFIKSKTFSYRPFKNSFNAILHSLITIN